jgi:bacterioferritin (cytochrome b1)
MSERKKKMDEMVKLEEDYAIRLGKDVTGLGNVTLQGLVAGVAYDSQKHAGLYKTMASLLEGGPLAATDIEVEEFKVILEKHIEVEDMMMQESKTLMDSEEDERVRFLLSEVYADEERHHAFMKNLLDVVVKFDSISERDLWEQLWRDVPTHGAPRDPFA